MKKGKPLYALLESIRGMCEIAPVDESVIDDALNLKAHDFEDAIQYYSALASGCDCIVTRNTKDFGFAKVVIYTPLMPNVRSAHSLPGEASTLSPPSCALQRS